MKLWRRTAISTNTQQALCTSFSKLLDVLLDYEKIVHTIDIRYITRLSLSYEIEYCHCPLVCLSI